MRGIIYPLGLNTYLGAVHKLRLQEEGGRWSKNRLFVNFYTIENVNRGGVGVQKKTDTNILNACLQEDIPTCLYIRRVDKLEKMYSNTTGELKYECSFKNDLQP